MLTAKTERLVPAAALVAGVALAALTFAGWRLPSTGHAGGARVTVGAVPTGTLSVSRTKPFVVASKLLRESEPPRARSGSRTSRRCRSWCVSARALRYRTLTGSCASSSRLERPRSIADRWPASGHGKTLKLSFRAAVEPRSPLAYGSRRGCPAASKDTARTSRSSLERKWPGKRLERAVSCALGRTCDRVGELRLSGVARARDWALLAGRLQGPDRALGQHGARDRHRRSRDRELDRAGRSQGG